MAPVQLDAYAREREAERQYRAGQTFTVVFYGLTNCSLQDCAILRYAPQPILPAFLPKVNIRDLKVGDARVELLLTRHDEGDVGVNVLRRNGALEILILK